MVDIRVRIGSRGARYGRGGEREEGGLGEAVVVWRMRGSHVERRSIDDPVRAHKLKYLNSNGKRSTRLTISIVSSSSGENLYQIPF
jgi:hypothetical protein